MARTTMFCRWELLCGHGDMWALPPPHGCISLPGEPILPGEGHAGGRPQNLTQDPHMGTILLGWWPALQQWGLHKNSFLLSSKCWAWSFASSQVETHFLHRITAWQALLQALLYELAVLCWSLNTVLGMYFGKNEISASIWRKINTHFSKTFIDQNLSGSWNVSDAWTKTSGVTKCYWKSFLSCCILLY